MNNDTMNNNPLQEEGSIDIKKELAYYFFFWPWFVATILITLSAAYFFLRYADRVYESTAQIQIKTDSDPASFLMTDLDPFNMDKVVVENDIAVITSQHILSQVVERLDLQTSIYDQGIIKSSLQFKNDLPFQVQFEELAWDQQWTLEVTGNLATIRTDSLNFTFKKGEILDTLYIKISAKDNLFLQDKTYIINPSSLNRSVDQLRKSLSVTPSAKKGR
jgi:uncharacterized protein involved in exopolysaccharide biosynthesis